MKHVELKNLIGKPLKTPSGRVLGVIVSAQADRNGICIKSTITDDVTKQLVNEMLRANEKIGGF